MTDADYTNILALLSNTPVQTKSLSHRSEQAAKGTGFYLGADKTVHVFETRKSHLYFKYQDFEISKRVHIPR